MIVVFGSINIDLVMAVANLPRPGETVLAPAYRALGGGKGANQALAAARAGAEVALYGCVGRDAFAGDALALLRRAGVDLGGVTERDAATGCAVVCVDRDGENQIVVASGANMLAGAGQVPDRVLGPATTLLLQLEVSESESHDLIARARRLGARIVLNAAPARPQPAAVLSALDILVVNEIEATMLADGVTTAAGGREAARAIAASHGLTVVVTLGGAGAAAFSPDGDWEVGALPVTPVDTTGAGDTFLGVFLAARDGGAEPEAALRQAAAAAAIQVTRPGAADAIPTARQVAAFLAEHGA